MLHKFISPAQPRDQINIILYFQNACVYFFSLNNKKWKDHKVGQRVEQLLALHVLQVQKELEIIKNAHHPLLQEVKAQQKQEVIQNVRFQLHLHVTQTVTVKVSENFQAKETLVEMDKVQGFENVEHHEMDEVEVEEENNLHSILQCSSTKILLKE
jgi:hypothetical protein